MEVQVVEFCNICLTIGVDIKFVQCNTVGQIFQNSLKSRLNSPRWEKMTPLNVQESLFGKLPIHWTNLIRFLTADTVFTATMYFTDILLHATLNEPATIFPATRAY